MRDSAPPQLPHFAIQSGTSQQHKQLHVLVRVCSIAFSVMGDQLALVNTTDSEHTMSTVTMCAREQWDSTQLQLVGHESPVVVARYSPKVFVDKADDGVAVVRPLSSLAHSSLCVSFSTFLERF
jgi:hypothetical protein